MISRLYVVLMPLETPGTALNILVESAPGTKDAPIVAGGDGAYYEWRGRPVRVPVHSGGAPPTAAAIAAGFTPRLRLGFQVTVTPYGAAIATDLPSVQLSESLAGDLSSTDVGPTISIAALADPAGEPVIRLVGGAGTAGLFYLVSLTCPEGKDEDRTSDGV